MSTINEKNKLNIHFLPRILIWLNKEDHFELNLNVSEPVLIRESAQRVLKLTSVLDKELDFEFSPKHGYFSTNPSYTGLGIKFSIILRIPANILTTFKQNLENFLVNSKFHIHFELKEEGDLWRLVFKKRAGVNQSDLLSLIDSVLKQLLENIAENIDAEEQEDVYEEVIRPMGDPIESQGALVNVRMQEEAHGVSKRTSTGFTLEKIKSNHAVDEECYSIFAHEIKEKFLVKFIICFY